VVGTVLGRSLVRNPTFDDLRCLKYAQELPLMTMVNFSYDNCRVWGKTNPTWILSKEGDSSFQDRYSRNRYFSYLFTQRGSYTITLEIYDTNGNARKVTKKELIRIV
jgi:PKD repeat protein